MGEMGWPPYKQVEEVVYLAVVGTFVGEKLMVVSPHSSFSHHMQGIAPDHQSSPPPGGGYPEGHCCSWAFCPVYNQWLSYAKSISICMLLPHPHQVQSSGRTANCCWLVGHTQQQQQPAIMLPKRREAPSNWFTIWKKHAISRNAGGPPFQRPCNPVYLTISGQGLSCQFYCLMQYNDNLFLLGKWYTLLFGHPPTMVFNTCAIMPHVPHNS
jgi:hypothetical protein